MQTVGGRDEKPEMRKTRDVRAMQIGGRDDKPKKTRDVRATQH
jgi:hypothetical protein